MNNQIIFTETLEEKTLRLLEVITLRKTGDVVYNSYFGGGTNGKLYHFNEPHSKGSKSWRYRQHLFYTKPEKGAYLLIELKITNNGDIHIYDNFRGIKSSSDYGKRINKVLHNGKLQKLTKTKKGRCEACGLTDDRTHWAHLVESKDLPVAELCMPCHRIYDLQGEGINFIDKAGGK